MLLKRREILDNGREVSCGWVGGVVGKGWGIFEKDEKEQEEILYAPMLRPNNRHTQKLHDV